MVITNQKRENDMKICESRNENKEADEINEPRKGSVVIGAVLIFAGLMTLFAVGIVLIAHHAINYMIFGTPVQFPWTLLDLVGTYIFFIWTCIAFGKPEIFRN